jgi:hypothetical protein
VIPVTLVRTYEPRSKAKEFKCVHCGVVLAQRHNTSKRCCLDCEHQTENDKRRARYHIVKAIASGTMLPASRYECWDCNEPAVCYDHRNYARPLDVQPVCKACNGRRGPAKLGGGRGK